MKNLKWLIIILVIHFNTSCVQENFDEELPPISVIDNDGNDYFMKGFYDGQPFEMNHSSLNENNRPNVGYMSSFVSEFITKGTNPTYINYFSLGISAPTDIPVTDVIKVGTFSFHEGPIPQPQDPFVWYLPPNIGFRHINGIPHSRAYDTDFDKIEIKEIEQLDVSDDININQNYNVFRVTGNFQVKLLAHDSIPVDMIVNEFSMFFGRRP